MAFDITIMLLFFLVALGVDISINLRRVSRNLDKLVKNKGAA